LQQNNEIFQFYKQLIELRKRYSVFRRAKPEDFNFFYHHDPHVVGCEISFEENGRKETYQIWLNGNSNTSQPFHFDKSWAKLVDHEKVYLFNRPIINGDYEIPETSALVLTSNLQN